MSVSKVCSKCQEMKSVSEFHRNRNSKDGLAYWCKSCVRTNSKSYFDRNREKVLAKNRKFSLSRREEDLERLRRWKEDHPELVAQGRKRESTARREEGAQRRFLWELEHPEYIVVFRGTRRQRHNARTQVAYAVARGRLVPEPCDECGAFDGVQAHHVDYSKPLDVIWLCPKHHQPCHYSSE